MTNQILTRIQHKHDVEANWRKAENFAPLEGELIIYDADYDEEQNPNGYQYPRFKVGIWDGDENNKLDYMLVNNLPFATSEQLLELGLSDYSIQQTDTGSLAGVRGFYWKELSPYHTSPASHRFVLENKPADQYNLFGPFDATEENLAYAESCFQPGDIITVHAGSKFDLAFRVNVVAEEMDESGKGMNRIVLSVAAQSDEIPLNLVNEYETTSDVTHFTNNAIFCPTKPSLGPIDFGKYAFAFGENSQATNYNATAFGRKNEAYGQYATAFGRENKVGYAGFAAGRNNTVSGESAAALNQGNTASGNWSLAGGYKSQATNSSSIAYGHSAKATGLYSTAFGEQAEANGAGTVAAGRYAKAEGEASQAFGRNTIAKSAYQFVSGKYNVEDNTETYAQIIGGGHADNNRINIHTVDWSGNAWYAGKVETAAGKLITLAEARAYDVGKKTSSSGETFNAAIDAGPNAHAEGQQTDALGRAAHSEGYKAHAPGDHSHAEGALTEAIGSSSHAEGEGSIARGTRSHAGGYGSVTIGSNAFAHGENVETGYEIAIDNICSLVDYNSSSKGEEWYSPMITGVDTELAEKISSSTVFPYSHNGQQYKVHIVGEGVELYWNGEYSYNDAVYGNVLYGEVAVDTSGFVDNNTWVSCTFECDPSVLREIGGGANSTAFGIKTQAQGSNQFVLGRYNVADRGSKYALIVGNGSNNQRANAMTLDWSGNLAASGDVKAGSISLKNTAATAQESQKLADDAKTIARTANNKIAIVYADPSLANKDDGGAKGLDAKSTFRYGLALGWGCYVTGSHGMAFGACVGAGSRQCAVGIANDPDRLYEGKKPLFMVGDGTTDGQKNPTVKSNSFAVLPNGKAYLGDNKVVTENSQPKFNSIIIGNTAFTEEQLKKILSFIETVEIGG